MVRLSPVCRSNRTVALATIYRSVLARLEWHFSINATCGTYGGIHLPAGTKAPLSASAFQLFCCAAVWATLGIVSEAFTGEELLLIGSKGKGSRTINTPQISVNETHWMTSFLTNCETSVIQYLQETCLEETFIGDL